MGRVRTYRRVGVLLGPRMAGVEGGRCDGGGWLQVRFLANNDDTSDLGPLYNAALAGARISETWSNLRLESFVVGHIILATRRGTTALVLFSASTCAWIAICQTHALGVQAAPIAPLERKRQPR